MQYNLLWNLFYVVTLTFSAQRFVPNIIYNFCEKLIAYME